MKISNVKNIQNDKNQYINFTGEGNFAESYSNTKNEFKQALKSKNQSKEVFEKIYKNLEGIEKEANNAIPKKAIPKIFETLVKTFGKIKIEKTGNKTLDTASRLTKVVLWGNVGKEAVGTTMYTVQALTNDDLPPDKRKFVGMYDLSVGVISTTFSFIFGVGLEKKIKNGYKKMLKPLSESENAAIRAKGAAAIVGLAAFSSFFLQTIIGKRIIAPAIATPAAGKIKTRMEENEKLKNQNIDSEINNDDLIAKNTMTTWAHSKIK